MMVIGAVTLVVQRGIAVLAVATMFNRWLSIYLS